MTNVSTAGSKNTAQENQNHKISGKTVGVYSRPEKPRMAQIAIVVTIVVITISVGVALFLSNQ
jgi:hypothetical protein